MGLSAPLETQRRFEKRLALFFLPLLLLLGATELLFWRARETWPIARVAAHQRENPQALFMRGMLDQAFYRYKLGNIRERAPKILVLGSSRVMEFRSEMFGARSAEFYNAGGMIQDLGDLADFAESLSNAVPEIVIIGLDLWWFNEALPLGRGLRDRSDYDAAKDWQAHVKAWRRIKSSRVRKPLFKAVSSETENIGIEARVSGSGFRADGSMHYKLAIPTNAAGWAFVDREKPPVTERIRNRLSQFVPMSGALDARLALLERTLDTFAQKGVQAAGFLPPFAEESARLMQESPEHRPLWEGVRSAVPKLFAKRGVPFVDVSRARDLKLDDRFLIDGMHGAETLHVHLLRELLRFEPLARRLPGLKERLGQMLASPQTNPWTPDYAAGGGHE